MFLKTLSSNSLSNPDVVSSKIISEGLDAKDIAIASLWVCPPLKVLPSSLMY